MSEAHEEPTAEDLERICRLNREVVEACSQASKDGIPDHVVSLILLELAIHTLSDMFCNLHIVEFLGEVLQRHHIGLIISTAPISRPSSNHTN